MWRRLFCLALIASLLVPPGVCTCHAPAPGEDMADNDHDSAPHDRHHHDDDHAPSCPMVRAILLPGMLTAGVELPTPDVLALPLPEAPVSLVSAAAPAVPLLFDDWPLPDRPLYLMLRALLI